VQYERVGVAVTLSSSLSRETDSSPGVCLVFMFYMIVSVNRYRVIRKGL
jgi:hypothetical protein